MKATAKEALDKRNEAMKTVGEIRKQTGAPKDSECDQQFYDQHEIDLKKAVEESPNE